MLKVQRMDNHGSKILCLGAHSDDIEIGCGGSLLRLMREWPNSEFYWVVFSAGMERKLEAVRSAQCFLEGARKTVRVEDYETSFFPYCGREIKQYFERLKEEFAPDLIFTHYRHDLHQDHRLISDLTWNTFRSHLILEYEIPKYDGDLGTPNFFVQLDEAGCSRKIELLLECFQTQRNKRWFSEDTFRSILMLRGIESGGAKYAEAFYSRKLIV